MTSYSGYELLGIKPGDSFSAAVSAFEQHACQLDLVAAVLEGRSEIVDRWRALCEALDWLVKQPIREPTKSMTCPKCARTNEVPLLEPRGGIKVGCNAC